MPRYRARHKKTGREVEFSSTISEMEEWERAHPDYEVLCGTPSFGDGYRLGVSHMKPHGDFVDRLKEIKKVHRKSTFEVP